MDVTGEITLPEGTEMVMPGDNLEITVKLIYPVLPCILPIPVSQTHESILLCKEVQ